MSQWLGLALVGELVVIFTHFASKQPVRRIHRLLAMPLVTAAALTLCVATAMVGWQATPPAEVQEPDTAPVAAPSPVAPELSRSVRMDADGRIEMPQMTENLQAAGVMPRDIEKEISSALVDGQILLHPIVTVAILGYAQRSVLAKAGWVTGNEGRPLLYSIKSPADATVLTVMASEIHIPLSDIMHGKAPDVTLQADDVLLIRDSDAKQMQEYYDTHPLTPPWEKAK